MTEKKSFEKSFEIDKEKFGAFVVQLRKAQGLTQKELAAQLYVSDKAVSKWERSLSLPDVTLLQPLADILGVTVAELLECKRFEATEVMEEEQSLSNTQAIAELYVSDEEVEKRKQRRKMWHRIFPVATGIMCAEFMVLLILGYTLQQLLEECLFVFELLFLLSGGYFCYWAKDVLPEYYDRYHISSYSDGVFRINIPVRISNRNWGAILQAIQLGGVIAMTVLPLLYLIAYQVGATIWNTYLPGITVLICLVAFGPMIIAAKKYE